MKIDTVREICNSIAQKNKLNLESPQKISFGFEKLDNLLGNKHLDGGNIICLSAKPGYGKSTLVLDFILNTAKSSKKEIIYFTSKYNSEQVVKKFIQKLSGLNLQNNIISEEEKQILSNALNELLELNITIFNFTSNISETIEEILEIKREISLIVIDDYNDFISFEKNALIKVKTLSKCFNVPILLCGNFPYSNNIKRNRKPNLYDLGKQVRYFDIVLFLHRDTYYPENKEIYDPNLTELIVAKNNAGCIDIIDLYYIFENICFREK